MPYGPLIPLGQFAPDLDPSTPGVLTDTNNVYGTLKGLRAMPGLEPGAIMSEPPYAVYSAQLPNGDRLTFAGTERMLYLYTGNAWTEWTSVTLDQVPQWVFTTYGNDVLAASSVNDILISRNGEPFVYITTLDDVTGDPPLASIVEASDYGLFAVSVNSDEWWFTGVVEAWDPTPITDTVFGRLTATPGPILNAKRLRNSIVMYKAESLYVGRYTGPPFIWTMGSVSNQVGCESPRAVVNVGDSHLFLGPDDFYQFDGSSLQRIPNGLREWFFDHANSKYLKDVIGRYDRLTNLVVWHYASNASEDGVPDTWLAYNLRAQKWTKGSQRVAAVVSPDMPVSGGLTYEQFADRYVLYDNVPDKQYDDPEFSGVVYGTPSFVDETGQLQFLSGVPGPSGFTTGNLGDGVRFAQLSQIRLQFAVFPSWSRMYTYRLRATGQPVSDPGPFAFPVVGPDAPLLRDGAYNVLTTGRVHRLLFLFDGEVEVTGLQPDMTDVGEY